MLTVKEINEVSFGKAGFSGYKPEDVDNFIDDVVSSFQQLEAERDDALKRAQELAAQNAELSAKNAEAQEKLAILAKKVESYREDEDDIKDALLSAQRMAKTSVQEAKDKAEVILQDAKLSAQQLMDNAKTEAARAAGEYQSQADAKKEELEEIKRQVSAFRSSLLEMYKKHLEQINHIPNFRQKEHAEPEEAARPEQEEAPAPIVERPQEPAPAPSPAPVPTPVEEAPQPQPQPQPQPKREQKPTLHDRVDFSSEQRGHDDGLADVDLSDVGIDLKSYSSIPESLRREKDNHFSNLEFGDDVDLDQKKRRK